MARETTNVNYKQELDPTTNATMVRSSSPTPTSLAEPTHQAIREKAYQIFLARAGKAGSPVDDWVQAERALKAARRPSK